MTSSPLSKSPLAKHTLRCFILLLLTLTSNNALGQENIGLEKARFKNKDFLIFGNSIEWDGKKKSLLSKEAVHIYWHGLLIKSSTLNYQIDSAVMLLGKSTLYTGTSSLQGASVKIEKGTAYLEKPLLHLLGQGHQSLNITGKTATYFKERQELLIEQPTLNLGKQKILRFKSWLVDLSHSNEDIPQLTLAYDSQLGLSSTLELQTQLNSSLLFKPSITHYTKRGWLPSVQFTYKDKSKGHYTDLSYGYLADKNPPQSTHTLPFSNPPEKRPHFTHLDFSLKDGEKTEFFGTTLIASSPFLLSDISHPLEKKNPFYRNFFQLNTQGDKNLLTLYAQHQNNVWIESEEKLPEITAHFFPQSFSSKKIYTSSQLSYTHFLNKNSEQKRAERLYAYLQFSKPLRLFKHITLRPILGLAGLYYNTPSPTYLSGKLLGETGFDLNIPLSKTYRFENKLWDIHHIRHKIKILLQHRFIKKISHGEKLDWPLEKTPPHPDYLPPLGLENRRDKDQMEPLNYFRLTISNRLETRDTTYGSRTLLHGKIYQDLYLKTGENQTINRRRSDCFLELTAHPLQALELSGSLRLNTGENTIERQSWSMALKSADNWQLSFKSFSDKSLGNQKIKEHQVEWALARNARNTVRLSSVYDGISEKWTHLSIEVDKHFQDGTLTVGLARVLKNGRSKNQIALKIPFLRF